MTTVNPFFASKSAEANISALFGAPKSEAASAIAAIVAGSPTVSAVPPTAGNAAAGKITAALMAPSSSGSEQAALPPINETASTPRELAIAEANAFMAQGVPDLFSRPLEPVTFSSGESAIAMGWNYIGELESIVSAVNTASRALNGHSVETARSLFGDDAAERIQKLNQLYAADTKSALQDRISTINRAFNVSGNLVETDDNGNLSMGRFTLTYDDGNFRANVATDQHAWVVQKGAVREVSVHQVSADLAAGKLML